MLQHLNVLIWKYQMSAVNIEIKNSELIKSYILGFSPE